jgi:SAM-dependent methyltransferase
MPHEGPSAEALIELVEQISWNDVWHARMQQRKSSAARECADIWADVEAARRYWQAVSETNEEHRRCGVESIPAGRDSRILDVGAGPGNMSIPLAERAEWVTAVEPAAGMAAVLEEKARERGLSNIRCIRKRWEDVDILSDLDAPYDVVIASYSLGMMDLSAAIAKMIRASRGSVHLYWFAGVTQWENLYRDLWPRLHGRPYHSGPKADVLFNVLYQMGVYPNMTVFPYRSVLRFDSMEDALEEMGRRTGVSDPRHSGPLRELLASRLETTDNGFVLTHAATCVKLWWDIENASCP